MPRKKSVVSQSVPIPTASLVASAVRYPGKAPRAFHHPKQDWQGEAYRHYGICGEARFGAQFFGHALSRAVLGVGIVDDGQIVLQNSGRAAAQLAELFNGKDGQKQMLEAIGIHFTIAGECYLVGREHMGNEVWEIVSCIEMQATGDTWRIDYGNGVPPIDLTEDDVVIRLWLPHPARKLEADSPFRTLLPILQEIEWLTRHIHAQVTSRLAGAGILMMPQSMTFPPPPETEDGQKVETTNDADSFMLTLADAMMTPIADPGSPAALVPIVVTAPDEAIDKAKLMHFWSELDAQSLALRSEAIRRFALGMDLPPEQILGMSSNGGTGGGTSNGVSHWGAWQIEESTIKMHVEPMLDAVVNSLTVGYLRPALGARDKSMVVYDTSGLRLRPDRSREAFELYDRGRLKVEALMRETGFSPDDIPDPEEFKLWLLVKVASGSATPEQVQAALSALGVDLQLTPPTELEPTREARPAPSLEDHPNEPRTPEESALVVASEALVFRALERAGNRLRNTGARPPNVPAYETHMYVKANGNTPYLLEDAWTCAAQVLQGVAEHTQVVPVLDAYCKSLLTTQANHARPALRAWLEKGGLL